MTALHNGLVVLRLLQWTAYGARLSLSPKPLRKTPPILSTILRYICHAFCFCVLVPLLHLQAQIYRPALAPPPTPASPSPNPEQPIRPVRPGAPDAEHVRIESVTQEANGPMRYLRGMVRIETTDMELRADELDYNSDTGELEARGHVHFEHFARGEKLDCARAEYNINTETGKFYDVSGSATARIQTRPGLLTTQNPFYFESKVAERLKDHYILHDGFLTDCTLPRPWWRLKGPTFEVVPGDHAIARSSWFYVRSIPIFYAPFFYKSLKKEPRRSGFLIPNFGNSSLRGKVIGGGYYWAINRSYDLTYRLRYFTLAGFAHHVDFRGDPNQRTTFDVLADGIQDRREIEPSPSGALILAHIKSDLGNGWLARGELDYITSFAFRQQFTESFNEAVFSETHSVGYLTKHWSDFGTNFVAQRDVNFQSTAPGDNISIRKFPEVQFTEREHQINVKGWPFWVSFDSSAGFLRRSQSLYQTRQFVDRLDFAPRITTAFRWSGIQLIPSFGIRETSYGSSVENGSFSGQNVLRNSQDAAVELVLPSLERVFNAPSWMAQKVKHVIEPRITYTYTRGIDDFSKIIRFDETDILSNTNQLEFSLTNRLLAKDKNGTVSDLLTWQLWYDRYFDPTFGGAIVPGQRNVVQSSLDLTGYGFLDGMRRSSPVVSALRLQSRVGLEWRADYDPLRHHIVNSSLSIDGRIKQYLISVAHTNLKTDPVLAPSANQFRGVIAYGAENRRGFSYGFSAYYDYRRGVMEYSQTQVTYNTDCCGLSVQYRRFNLGIRDESQFRVSFAVSNIGTFGTLKRQERIF
jgi:LPS-assembly protein